MSASGIHHITGITADVQANVDFYVGFLGLKLVKQTGGFADATQLHLIYGDGLGSPGSLLTFLVWEASGRGRTGVGQVSEVALAIPKVTIGDWLTKALLANVPVEGPVREFNEPLLRLKDPDGLIVKLVGIELPTPAPLPGAPTRIRGATLLTDKPADSADFLRKFGYRYGERIGATQRMVSDTDVVDVREVTGFVPSVAGAGVPDHVAFRAEDHDAVRGLRIALEDYGPTEVHDRKYFLSLYVRDPANILLECATDGPGMAVDEAPPELGTTLFVPPHETDRAEDLMAMLPQFALPWQERVPPRDLPFVHRFNRPRDPDGTTLILLHGSGGSEADLMPFARRVAPNADLLGVRGRASEEGTNRWFRRFDDGTFDQADIRSEAAAFAAFVEGAISGYGLDPETLAFAGYSNGANFLLSLMLLRPDTVRNAVLLRCVRVLDGAGTPHLSGHRLLVLNGKSDPHAVGGAALVQDLSDRGAKVESYDVPAGHDLSTSDVAETAKWLAGLFAEPFARGQRANGTMSTLSSDGGGFDGAAHGSAAVGN